MANNFLNMKSNPELYIMIPPPSYARNKMSKTINEILPKIIPELAQELGVPKDRVIS